MLDASIEFPLISFVLYRAHSLMTVRADDSDICGKLRTQIRSRDCSCWIQVVCPRRVFRFLWYFSVLKMWDRSPSQKSRNASDRIKQVFRQLFEFITGKCNVYMIRILTELQRAIVFLVSLTSLFNCSENDVGYIVFYVFFARCPSFGWIIWLRLTLVCITNLLSELCEPLEFTSCVLERVPVMADSALRDE